MKIFPILHLFVSVLLLSSCADNSTGTNSDSSGSQPEVLNSSSSHDSSNISIENEALRITFPQGIMNGELIHIFAKGSTDFGEHGPDLLYYQDLAQDNDSVSLNSHFGHATVTSNKYGPPLVEAVPELPYGKGLVIGSLGEQQNSSDYRQITVLDTQALSEFYEFYYLYYPEEHQEKGRDHLDSNAIWNFKPIWHYHSGDGFSNSEDVDIFAAGPGWYGKGLYWSGGRIGSNKKPTSTMDRSSSGLISPTDRTRIRSNPLCRQLWVKMGLAAGSAENSDGMYLVMDSEDGIVEDVDYYENGKWTGEENTTLGVDRITIPGYVRGYNVPIGSYAYFSQIYQTTGEGAAARIEVSDAEEYSQSKKTTIFTIESWGSKGIEATIRSGIFYQEGLSGKYIHIFNAKNDYVAYGGQIP